MADTKTAADVADHALTQIDNFSQTVATLAEKLADAAQQHGAQAWELALAASRVDAANKLLWASVVFPVAAFALFKFAIPLVKKGIGQEREWTAALYGDKRPLPPDGTAPIVAGFLAVAAAIVALGVSGVALSNVWAWAGLFEPKLWLAMKVLKLG